MAQIVWLEISRKGQPIPVILIDAVITGFVKHFTEFHDGKTKINHYRQVLNARWIGKKDFEGYVKMFKENEEKITDWFSAWRKHFTVFKRYSEKLRDIDFSKKVNKELKRLYEKSFELYAKACSYTYDYKALGEFYPEMITAFLKKRTKNAKNLNKWLEEIFSLDRPINLHEGKIALLDLAIKVKTKKLSSDETYQAVEEHAKKYGFLGQYLYYGNPITLYEFREKLERMRKRTVAQLKREKQEISARFEQNRKNVKRLKEKLKLNKEEVRAINNVKEALYTSMFCDELYSLTAFNLKPFLTEVCKRFNLSYSQIIRMRNKEIVDLLSEGKISKKLLEDLNLRKGHDMLLEDKKVKVLTGKELEKYTEKLRLREKELKKLKELKGETAFPGKVRGRVRMLLAIENLPLFKEGEILVAACTNPQQVPAMKKAAAIITDEGGMLSHAAIMSREFNKPCVIGTKIATLVLKDRDMVEVNATDGIVKILEKED